jgi:hypothetical protein
MNVDRMSWKVVATQSSYVHQLECRDLSAVGRPPVGGRRPAQRPRANLVKPSQRPPTLFIFHFTISAIHILLQHFHSALQSNCIVSDFNSLLVTRSKIINLVLGYC